MPSGLASPPLGTDLPLTHGETGAFQRGKSAQLIAAAGKSATADGWRFGLVEASRHQQYFFAVPSPPAGIAWVAGFNAVDAGGYRQLSFRPDTVIVALHAGLLEPCRAGLRKISSAAICCISMRASWKRYPYPRPILALCAASQDSESRACVDGLMSARFCPSSNTSERPCLNQKRPLA